jgi:poly(A) polymerase
MSASAIALARGALSQRRAWIVGGAVRDGALGRQLREDLDIVIDGDPGEAARALAGHARQAGSPAACFSLSQEFGGWRVVARDGAWQVDFEPLRGGSLEADLLLRDFTVNAIAEPISGGVRIDPLGGLEDLAVGVLRAAGPSAFDDDPLRVLRLVRIAVELGLKPEATTSRLAHASAGRLRLVAAERIFAELCRIVDAPAAVRGLRLLGDLGAAAVVLPEIDRMVGVQQSHFHHLDVYDHTMEALQQAICLQQDPAAWLTQAGVEHGAAVAAVVQELLLEPLADGLNRGSALRWGALLHDVAKPATRAVRASDGRVTFIGHDAIGAEVAAELLCRLRASERLQSHVAALVRHHLRLGFLVHEPQPLARRTIFSYLRATSPVAADVTLLSIADRLATRGAKAQESIAAHMRLGSGVLQAALDWHLQGPPQPLVRGDELAAQLGIAAGPRLGRLLGELAEAQYAGEIDTREAAIAYARRVNRLCADEPRP